MPTQIIDNFDLTSQLPLDARLVVGPNAFFQTRDAIKNKYYGLRIWDFNDNLPYVWTGSSWENESSGSVLVTNGQGGFLSKFTGSGTSNTITKSLIYEFVSGSNTFIGINKTLPAYQLDVNGNISSSSGFIGPGALITGINATNITGGDLSLARISTIGALSNSLLFYNGTSTIWRPQTQIRVASATGIEVTEDNGNTNVHDLLFYIDTNTVTDNISPTSYKVKSSERLQFKPSTGQLILSNGTALDPGFTFKAHPSGRAGMFLDLSNGAWWNGGLVITFEQNQGVGVTDNTSKGERLRIIGGGGSGNWASNFFFHSNNYISKSLLLSVSDGGVTAAAPGKATFYSNSLSGVEWLNQGNFTIGSSTTINGSLTITPSALTTQALTINGVTTMNGVTNVAANFNVGASGNLKTATINGSLIVGGTTADQFQVSGMKALFTGSQISMGLSHDTIAFHGGILPKLVVKSSFGDANDGKVALFTNGLWTTGKSAIIYLGDGNHYLSSTYGGTFDIKSSDSIKLISGASTRVYLNNSSGNVGIGTEIPTSPLTVNGNIRTDSDFVTGTDTAGWSTALVTYGSVKQFWTSNSTWQNLTPTSDSVFRWKIIGKTLILKFYIETTGDLGANGGVFQIRIPTALQTKILNHMPTPSGNLVGYQLEDSIIMAPAYGYLWAQVRKYNNQAFPDEWILYMNNTNALYTVTNGGDFRGNVILELI